MWGGGQSRCRGTAAQILLCGCLSPKSVTHQGLSSWKGSSETNILQICISGVKPFGKYQSRQPEAVNSL